MKILHHLKNNLLYYLSVIDVAATGFAFHIIHIVTKHKRPHKMSKEMLEELERLISEERLERKKRPPVEEPGAKE